MPRAPKFSLHPRNLLFLAREFRVGEERAMLSAVL